MTLFWAVKNIAEWVLHDWKWIGVGLGQGFLRPQGVCALLLHIVCDMHKKVASDCAQ